MKYSLFFAIVLAFVLFTSPVLANNCCVPQYEDVAAGIMYTDNTDPSPPTQQAHCDALSTNVDYLLDENCVDIEIGCCCTDYGTVAIAGIADSPSVYHYYCDEAGSNNYDFTQQGGVIGAGYATCSAFCAQGPLPTFNVSGHVYSSLDDSPLPGASVMAVQAGQSDLTNQGGEYELENLPNDWNTIEASVPDPYLLANMNLTCEPASTYIYLTENREINFTLTCEEAQQTCEPYWQVGPWGPCVPYGSIQVQFREVTDLNNCSTNIGKPASINLTACEGIVLNDCGNGDIDGTERCDINIDDEADFEYRLLNGEVVSTQPFCEAFLPYIEEEETYRVSCTETCNYDFSDCQGCGPICSHPNQCEICDACIGDPLCGDECDSVVPDFVNAFDASSTRNVFDLYLAIQADPTNYAGFDYGMHYVEGTRDVVIEWNYNEECKHTIMGYRITFCEEDGEERVCTGSSTTRSYVIEGMNTGQEEYVLTNVLEANTSYCYNVCAIALDGSLRCARNASEELLCFKTGDEPCLEPHEPGLNCEFDSNQYSPFGCIHQSNGVTFSYTNLTYDVSEECATGKTCVETIYDPLNNLPGAECRETALCDRCNGLFGLYAQYNLETYIGNPDNGNSVTCDHLLYSPSQEPDDNDGLCYKDRTLTPQPMYKACENVLSCYDYKSQEACETDYCYRFTNESLYNDCKWVDYNAETGTGICRPKSVENQNCHACETDSPTGFCTEEMCKLYGECYYKDKANHGEQEQTYRPYYYAGSSSSVDVNEFLDKLSPHNMEYPLCLSKEEMSCYLYDDKQDCVGDGEVNVNVLYETEPSDELQILAGNNTRMNLSEDVFGFGTCAWNDNSSEEEYYGCHKNSDDDYNRFNPDEPLSSAQDDCIDYHMGSFQFYKNCFQDTTPPITNLTLRPAIEQEQYRWEGTGDYLPVYGRYEIASIPFAASDDHSTDNYINTYVTFISLQNCKNKQCFPPNDCTNCENAQAAKDCYAQDCEVYPQHEFEEFLTNEDLSQRLITNGEHIMAYYSVDKARNLEEVHYERIYIDIQGPELDSYEKEIISFKLAEDIYASNLTINFTVTEPSLCEGTLYLNRIDGTQKTHPYGDFIIANKTSFGTFYRELPDGDYNFTITCHDEFNNPFYYNDIFRIEGDASIANPQPRGDVFNDVSTILLSLETANNATCRLNYMENATYAQSSPTFENTGEMYHTQDFYPDLDSTNTSGLFIYYTSCLFDNGSITQQVPSDVISFTVDVEAPVSELLVEEPENSGTYVPYDHDEVTYASFREMSITCNDSNELTPLVKFDCGTIYYCFGQPIEDMTQFDPSIHCSQGSWQEHQGHELELSLNYFDHSDQFIYYYAQDQGGNAEEETHFANIKIRDTSFFPPTFTIITD